MPTTRVTVALNSKQSQRAPLLVPASTPLDPTSSSSVKSLVFKAAQSKLRLKKPSRVYVAGTGRELLNEEDWQESLKDDVVLLVSAGEEYVGLRKEEKKAHGKFCVVQFPTNVFPQAEQKEGQTRPLRAHCGASVGMTCSLRKCKLTPA